jgi:archaellum component FlaG (FlaF/FlaG flagellin family)
VQRQTVKSTFLALKAMSIIIMLKVAVLTEAAEIGVLAKDASAPSDNWDDSENNDVDLLNRRSSSDWNGR